MKIFNKTKKTILTEDAFEAITFSDRSLGLLDSKKPRTLLFRTRFGIHTLGMKHAIDVLILNKLGKVVKLKRDLKPNAFFTWNPKYSTVIELPAGTILKTRTEVDDQIHITS